MLPKIKSLLVLSLLTFGITAYADGPYYNCQSNAENFNVKVVNGMCQWQVKTGVVTPVGNYQPKVARLYGVTFSVKHPSVANCSPTSYNAKIMTADETISCTYVPVGAKDRPQELSDEDIYEPYMVQEFKNNKWTNDGSSCQSESENCRFAPSSNQ